MTKLRIDLSTTSADIADRFRLCVLKILDMGDTKTRLTTGQTVVEFDYGLNDLTRFTQILYPHPKMLLREAANTRDDAAIVAMFGTDVYKDAAKDLLETARQACRDMVYPPDPADLSDELDQPARAAIADILAGNEGFVLGGSHDDNTHRDPIVEALNAGTISAANGTGLLFIEEISTFVQDELDAFLADAGDEMPAFLRGYLKTVGDTQGKFDFEGMVRLAKSKGVRVVGIDTADSKILDDVPSAVHHEQRCAKMNMDAADIMEAAKADAVRTGRPTKFVALVGAAHTNTHEGGVPGISQLMGVPGLAATAGGRLVQKRDDPAKRGMPPKEQSDFIDAYLGALDAAFGEDQGDLMDWREQREAAQAKATELALAGQLGPGTDVAALVAGPAVTLAVTETKDRMVQRGVDKAALGQLIDAGDLVQARLRITALSQADGNFLRFDQTSHKTPSLASRAVSAGHGVLLADLVAGGARPGTPVESDALLDAALAAFDRDKGTPGITPVTAELNLNTALGQVIGSGIDVHGANKKGDTLLEKLVSRGLGTQAGLLIAVGADVGAKTKAGKSMVEEAVRGGSASSVTALAAGGASVDTTTPDGSMLQNALRAGKTDVARALILAGAGVNRAHGSDGQTELHLAIAQGDQTLIDDLIAVGADPTAANAKGETALDAFLVARVTRMADEATNGPRRAVLAKEAEIVAKQDEIAAGVLRLAALRARQDVIAEDARAGRMDQLTATRELLDIIQTQIPAENAAQARRGLDDLALQAQLPALKAADPLEAKINAFEGMITVLEQSLVGLNERDQAPIKAQIADEKQHLVRLSAVQPIDHELIRAQVAALKATLAPTATIADLRTEIDTNPAVAVTVTTLQTKLSDRQSGVIDISEAVRTGNVHRLNQLITADPTLVNARVPGDPNERTLLHLAAKNLNEPMLQALLLHHPDLTLHAKNGGTALHEVFGTRKDADADKATQARLTGHLLVAGTAIDHRDAMGMTGLHLACLDGNPGAVTALIQGGANEALTDARGWTAKDVVTATTKPLAEAAYAAASLTNPERPLVADAEVSVDTVEILMRATKCENPEDVAKVRGMFENLYADAALRPMLQLAALDAANARVAGVDGIETGLRIYVAKDQQVGLLYNSATIPRKAPSISSPRGAYEETSHVVMMGAGAVDGHFSAGTLIHELTHACTRILYGKDDVPFEAPDGGYVDVGGKLRTDVPVPPYVTAILDDAKQSALLCGDNKDEKKIYETLFGRMDGGYKAKGDKALLQEYLVSVPQLIAEYGLPAVRKVAPGLTDYFTGSFSDACTAMADHDDYAGVRGKLNDVALIARVGDDPVVSPVSDKVKSGGASATLDGIMEKVKALYLAENGAVVLKPGDVAHAAKLSLPTGSGSFDITDPTAKRLCVARMRDVRKGLEAVYDPGAMPKTLSTDMLRGFVTDVTALAVNQSGRGLKSALGAAAGNFTRDAKRSDLNEKLAGGDKLTNREIAELALIRSEDAVWTAANPHAAPPPHPAYDKAKHGKLVASMERKLDATFIDTPESRRKAGALMNDPVAFEAFIEAQKDAIIAADRALRANGAEVRIDKDRSKRAWFAELQRLAA
jgi:ankyrin repeat protein